MHTKYVVFYVILTSLITGASCHMGTFSQGLYLSASVYFQEQWFNLLYKPSVNKEPNYDHVYEVKFKTNKK